MKKVTFIVLALVAVCLLVAPLALGQGGNPPASTKESGATSGHGMTAVEQTGKSSAGDVVGTWMLVSETAHQGGKTTEPLGPNPLGSIMFDRGGRFMLLISRPGLPKFAAGKRDAGTPEENKAVLAGMLAFIGPARSATTSRSCTLRPARSPTGLEPTRSVPSRSPAMK
jgi:hypothetical protein